MLVNQLLLPTLMLKSEILRIKFSITLNILVLLNLIHQLPSFDKILKPANLATKSALDTVLEHANKNERKIKKLKRLI